MIRSAAFMFLLLIGCKTGDNKPAGLLTEEQMIKQLTEIYVAEGKIVEMGVQVDSGAKVFSIYSQKIDEKTGVPDSVFRSSLEYYSRHPEQLDKIYSALVDSLNLMEQRSSVKK